MAKRDNGGRESFWQGAVKRRLDSGMSVVDFCASEGLKATAFYYWQRKLRRREGPAPMPQPASGPTLAPVQLIDDRSRSAQVEIVAGNGHVIRVGEHATTEHVRRVLQAVGELD